MYFIDFIKSLAKKHRIPVIIYLALNVVIITYCINWVASEGQGFNWVSIPIALGIYAVSIIIALSPFGEWILRLQMGCKKIKRVDYAERLTPVFKEVYARAKQANPALPDDIELFMNEDKAPNAFATGRRTICLTKGMYEHASDEELKGVLAHEFSHIANHDTDLILVVTVGNMIITAIIIMIRLFFRLLSLVGVFSNVFGSRQGNLSIILAFVGDLVIAALMWIWTKLGQYLVLATGRSEEYLADEFSLKLGYSEGLCRFLDRIDGGSTKGVFAVLSSSHPATDDRIAKLQQLGCKYRVN
ncbi:MAG: M48 family metalloprotease [Butyrivibrio sp.]|jgi:heat shock protein HtpX|nr:M48 family metalloprotease [Butyrivibrio sp.]